MIHGLDSGSGRLGPAERSAALAELRSLSAGPAGPARPLDVVIVGGGVVGAGAALDAVTRGLSVALFEARDWASGTSRSSKLIHGGLRYLEMLDFALVREALQRARPAAQPAGAAPGPAGAVPLPADAPRLGAPLRRRRRRALRHDGPGSAGNAAACRATGT